MNLLRRFFPEVVTHVNLRRSVVKNSAGYNIVELMGCSVPCSPQPHQPLLIIAHLPIWESHTSLRAIHPALLLQEWKSLPGLPSNIQGTSCDEHQELV